MQVDLRGFDIWIICKESRGVFFFSFQYNYRFRYTDQILVHPRVGMKPIKVAGGFLFPGSLIGDPWVYNMT